MPETIINLINCSCPIETAGQPYIEVFGTGRNSRTYELHAKSELGEDIIGTCDNLAGGQKRLNSELNKIYNGINVDFVLKAIDFPTDESPIYNLTLNNCTTEEVQKNPFPPFVAKGWDVPQANPFA